MQTVNQRLQKTPEEYSDLLFQIWIQWCASRTQNQTALQKLLICQPLSNWWHAEIRKLESDFMEATEPYKDSIGKKDLLKMWAENIFPIYSRFSKPLIKKAYERYTITEQN